MSDLYDADILEWSERQADLLRRVAAGEQLHDAAPDWPNIIEEVESVGRDQLHAVRGRVASCKRRWTVSPRFRCRRLAL
jgi:hypothetical protein